VACAHTNTHSYILSGMHSTASAHTHKTLISRLTRAVWATWSCRALLARDSGQGPYRKAQSQQPLHLLLAGGQVASFSAGHVQGGLPRLHSEHAHRRLYQYILGSVTQGPFTAVPTCCCAPHATCTLVPGIDCNACHLWTYAQAQQLGSLSPQSALS
jgi:hypothetical protein